jgi:hypothetical protein
MKNDLREEACELLRLKKRESAGTWPRPHKENDDGVNAPQLAKSTLRVAVRMKLIPIE